MYLKMWRETHNANTHHAPTQLVQCCTVVNTHIKLSVEVKYSDDGEVSSHTHTLDKTTLYKILFCLSQFHLCESSTKTSPYLFLYGKLQCHLLQRGNFIKKWR